MAINNKSLMHKNFFLEHSPLVRCILGLIVGASIFFLMQDNGGNYLLPAIAGWVGFAAVFVILSWYIIVKRKVEDIKRKANEDDGSVVFVFIVIIISSLASMVAVLMLTTSKDKAVHDHAFMVPTAVVAMVLSWVLVHTQYVFHYAHEYYDCDGAEENNTVGDLDFPEDDKPVYLDFAYFSFCMGCTFQVSDVEVTSKLMRRIVMFHGLLSFFINTFVVALTINLVAGLSQ